MSSFIDLHMHTVYSDGLSTPEQIVNDVRKKNLSAFAISDHDTIGGYRAVKELLGENDPELITGVELSTSFENADLHVLAYLFDPDNEDFNKAMVDFLEIRNIRAKLIVEKLNDMGIEITYEQVRENAGGDVIGRPHIAEVMYKNKAVTSYNEAFNKYIGNGKPANVVKKSFSPEKALSLIHNAGGIAVLAHPVIEDNERFIEKLVDFGLDGIEVFHPYHKHHDRDRLIKTAERLSLVISGGSDYHGRSGRMSEVGSQKVKSELLINLKERAKKVREHN